MQGARDPGRHSLWEPLRTPAFRMLWTAQFVSNIGTWMQTVGAQWFLVGASASPALVALVQTATSLPILLLALPAGVLADLVDRRRLLISTQAAMALVAALLAVTTLAGGLTPAGLLIATFTLGIGVAASTPAWQAVQPDMVSGELLPTAATLSGASINVGRAAGPAIGGVVVALAGPGWTFALNAASFLVVVGALVRWRSAPAPSRARERIGAAMRTGLGYARHSPPIRQLLVRAGLWTVPASIVWALLPVISHTELHLGSAGYGLLLASVGVGAVLGAVVLTPLRHRISVNRLLTASGIVYTVALVGIGTVASIPVVLVLLLAAGACWIAVLSTLNAAAQVLLPRWVRARGIGVYVLVLQGGQALGAAVWGIVAERTTGPTAFVAAGAVLLVATLAVSRWGFDRPVTPEPGVPVPWMAADFVADGAADGAAPAGGPVRVVVTYEVRDERVADFLATVRVVRAARLRGGARRWACRADPESSGRFLESYLVATVRDAVALNGERLTAQDRAALDEVVGCTQTQPWARFESLPPPAGQRRGRAGRWGR